MIPAMRSLKLEERDRATSIFNDIIMRFEHSQTPEAECGYKPITLIALMEKEVSEKDEFLRLFFSFIGQNPSTEGGEWETDVEHMLSRLASFDSWTTEEIDALRESLAAFAKYLVDNSLLPRRSPELMQDARPLLCSVKAFAAHTPQPTPAPLSPSILSDAAISTPQRVSILRRDCLARDRHRCVITRKFDAEEAGTRWKREKHNMKDDDGQLFSERDTFAFVEVAHIIPHFMPLSNEGGERKLASGHTIASTDAWLTMFQVESKQVAHRILNMFNPTAVNLINGPNIDRPRNALTPTHGLHRQFGEFDIAFEPIGPEPHTYKIDHVDPDDFVSVEKLLITVTLYLTPDRTIDPPSPELLEIHRAIGRILHVSAVGDYIEGFLRDMEEMEGGGVIPNGSSRLDDFVRFRLTVTGWLEGRSPAL
ncbi:hypothetical protein CNMCM7691_007594 [Aspergillus felis]|uniref:HNH nuclease domain-containing protein n=1 Tax=Aspergillus felis TaxID=1287682 RepID=A0A8H6V9H0_9EURO|nr:hypothetical protein CNMCM7691_007594 [Aspergillus felis]